jgi:hypothetical protein
MMTRKKSSAQHGNRNYSGKEKCGPAGEEKADPTTPIERGGMEKRERELKCGGKYIE